MFTERNGVAFLGISPVHIPTGSSALLLGGSIFYVDPSDKHLNNYTTDSCQILYNLSLSSCPTFRSVSTNSGSVAKQRPPSEHEVQTQQHKLGRHATTAGFTKLAEM